jgi:hypothetical protein
VRNHLPGLGKSDSGLQRRMCVKYTLESTTPGVDAGEIAVRVQQKLLGIRSANWVQLVVDIKYYIYSRYG